MISCLDLLCAYVRDLVAVPMMGIPTSNPSSPRGKAKSTREPHSNNSSSDKNAPPSNQPGVPVAVNRDGKVIVQYEGDKDFSGIRVIEYEVMGLSEDLEMASMVKDSEIGAFTSCLCGSLQSLLMVPFIIVFYIIAGLLTMLFGGLIKTAKKAKKGAKKGKRVSHHDDLEKGGLSIRLGEIVLLPTPILAEDGESFIDVYTHSFT